MEPRNRFQGMNSARLCTNLAGRYDNPIPTYRGLFLAPIDFLKIPARLSPSRLIMADKGELGTELSFLPKNRSGSGEWT